MIPVPIPAWTPDGVLPPIDAAQPASPERSPYLVSLTNYVLRFGDTPERRAILDGYLRYRALLHGAGLVRGFQWLDGSFLEQVEAIEGRPPNDIDVVTFYYLPTRTSQRQLIARAPTLADHALVKARFRVDGYLVHLGIAPEELAGLSAYWYSLWAHRRSRLWKGFVQVGLQPDDDAAAAATLASLGGAGGQP